MVVQKRAFFLTLGKSVKATIATLIAAKIARVKNISYKIPAASETDDSAICKGSKEKMVRRKSVVKTWSTHLNKHIYFSKALNEVDRFPRKQDLQGTTKQFSIARALLGLFLSE